VVKTVELSSSIPYCVCFIVEGTAFQEATHHTIEI